jgi:protein TonB
MGVVAGLHVAVVYLVASGLGIVPKMELPTRLEGTIIDERPTIDDEWPPEIPYVPDRTPVTFPEPDVPPIEQAEATDAIQGEFVPDPLPVQPAIPDHQPLLVGVRPDARYPLTRPNYPSEAVRRDLEGTVEIEVYVLPNGRVGDARVFRSTGHAVLDQAAIDEAKRRWRLQPATRDGVPYAQWHKFRVLFDLQDR